MGRQHVDHAEIACFAQERVNLPRGKANEYRAQVRRLREKLEAYLAENPDFSLKKILLSGSLAKGTALRSLNDVDVACYSSGADAPRDISELLEFLAERLRTAFPNFSPDQVQPQTYSVTASFEHGWILASDERRRLRQVAESRIGKDRIIGTADCFVLAIRQGVITVEEADADKVIDPPLDPALPSPETLEWANMN